MTLNPSHEESSLLLAEVLVTQEKTDEAIQCLKDLIKHNHSCYKPRIKLAKLLTEQNQIMEAIELLHHTAALNFNYHEEVNQVSHLIQYYLIKSFYFDHSLGIRTFRRVIER